ncbi:hypothetical protein KCP74_10290 [Salmonella enterica subsp. enterica]|nr:hypothetical protein KCP74_10290 [Salmonella enterica subsp. enterica]
MLLFARFSACRSFSASPTLGVLVVQQRELRQYDESEESSSSRSLRKWRLSCHSRRPSASPGNTGRRESARFLRRRAWLSQIGKTRPCC